MKHRAIIILTLFFFILSGCTDPITREIYLIPDNFIGNVIVVYNYPKGEKENIIGSTIIYKIPQNGVLFSQGNQHVLNFKYMKYFYVKNNNWNRINDPEINYRNGLCRATTYTHHIESFAKNPQDKVYQYVVIGIGTKDSIPPEFNPDSIDFEHGKVF